MRRATAFHLGLLGALLLATCASASLTAGSGTSSRPAHRRVVSCEHAAKDIPSTGALSLYNIGFEDETINFDTLAALSFAAEKAVDLGEFVNTVNAIKAQINDASENNTVARKAALWNATWATLAYENELEGDNHKAAGDVISAAASWQAASSYYQLAIRFSKVAESDAIARRSVQVFEKAVVLDTNGAYPTCAPVEVPFNGSTMHGYWCPVRTTGGFNVSVVPTIIAVNGFDGTAEMFVKDLAAGLVPRGYNLLIMEGPGQGTTARFNHLYLQPNYEQPVSAMVDFAIDNYGVNQSSLIMWGVSFGGYLAPRAFAFEPRFAALVANGGVLDFYQNLVCKWPADLRSLYFANSAHYDALINDGFRKASIDKEAAAFLLDYSALDFGVPDINATQILDRMMPYTLNTSDALGRLSDRPMYVYDPAWDTLTGNQSQLLWDAIPNKSPLATLRQLDPRRGAGLHCGIGSTVRLLNDVARWLRTVV